MPIPLPNLDDRRWADLVEEGRSLIPVFAPEWTDHNVSDPGITLIELFAWVTEADIYRANRIPDLHKRKFLALAGLRPETPAPAHTVLAFDLRGGPSVRLPAGTAFAGTDPAGDVTRFRTLDTVNVVGARIAAIQVEAAGVFRNVGSQLERNESIEPFGHAPVPGSALYLGFSAALPSEPVTLFFNFGGPRTDRAERLRLGDPLPPHHSARVVWEYFPEGGTSWQSVDVQDGTRSMTLDGIVRLTVQDAMKRQALGQVETELYYLRCRFRAGAFDAPPKIERLALNAVEAEQAIPAYQTWVIAKGVVAAGTAPQPGDFADVHLEFNTEGAISSLSFEPGTDDEPKFVVLGYQAATNLVAGTLGLEAVRVGRATGAPNQRHSLAGAPVIEAGFQLYSLEQGRWRTCRRRDDLVASGPADFDFVLDASTGDIAFGDAAHGRVPPHNAVLMAVYSTTRAEDGNLAAGAVNRLDDSPHNRAFAGNPAALNSRFRVANVVPAEGGAAAETLAHTIGRAIELREAPLRAVTLADHEVLAMATPGTHIGRVTARANLFTGFDCVVASGVVTVIIVPASPGPKPTPSPGLLHAVAAYLEPRRMIGTRVAVVGPEFLEVSVHARVKAFSHVNRAQLARAVAEALDRFFDPLQGGPEGAGWPFGRDVYRSEVLEVIDGVPGVDHVLSLDLIGGGCEPQCGNLCLPPAWLVAAAPHIIEVI